MLKIIDSIAERYRDKPIFVWEVKRNSMVAFAMLAFRGINIAGFVSEEKRYVGETFFNRPVYGVEDFKNNAEAVIVATTACVKTDIPDGINIYYWDEILEINPELREKKIIVYGIGEGSKRLYKRLKENDIKIEAFCVTDKDAPTHANLPLLSLDEVPLDEEHAVIISALEETYRCEMLYNLEKRKVQTIFIDEFISPMDISMSTFVQSLYKAIIEEKKIYIYTQSIDENARFLAKILKLYQVEVDGYLYSGKYSDENIKDIYDMYEDLPNIFIIINEMDKRRLQDACELLEDLGFSLGAFNDTGIKNPAYNYKVIPKSMRDSLQGYVELGEKVGFHIYGHEHPDDIRIVITGGSTSNDGTFRGVCWPRMLYRKLCDNGYHVTIYNGAHCGHRVVQEFLQFIRDGWYFKPHFLISMSGVNDTAINYPEIKNKFYLSHLIDKEIQLNIENRCAHGLDIEEDCFDFWVRMERMLRAVAEECETKFLCFLQPMKFGKKNKNLFEECLHDDEGREGDEFRNKASNNDFYINLIDIFDDDDMYIDACHYSEKAKQILANIVYNEIMQLLE